MAFLSKKLRKSIDKVRVILYNKYVALSNVKYADVAELADALASGSVTTVNLFAWLLSGSS